MTVQSIVCGACAAEVPYGRLSCPSCGELLASVAGSRRGSRAGAARPSIPDVLYEPGSAPATAVVDGQLALDPEGDGDGLEALIDRRDAPPVQAPPPNPADRESDPDVDPAWEPAASGLTGSPTPAYMPRPATRTVVRPPTPVDVVAASVATAAPSPAFAGPGAYVPPPLAAAVPAGPAAPAREWAGHAASSIEAAVDPRPVPEAASDSDTRARIADFARWLTVAGSAFAAVGFLLPWGLVVIGSSDVGYFGRWGIAGPWHVVVALAVLAVLGLALVQNPVPLWLRTGVAGLGLGALVLGLVWPYITLSALGTGPGAVIAAIGAAGLVAAGLLVLVTDRHAGDARPV